MSPMSERPLPDKKFLRLEEVAVLWRLSYRATRDEIRRREVPVIRIGKRGARVLESDALRFEPRPGTT
jgi:hypothetical protein